MPKTLYEVLRETVVGDYDHLEHIWTIGLKPSIVSWLKVYAHCDDGGDKDTGFRFSYSTGPEGPDKPVFRVDAKSDDFRWFGLPRGLSGALYVKVEDTDRTPGQKKPDTLYVDARFIIYEITKSPFRMGDQIGCRPMDAARDLGLCGSSHVGYLGGIVAIKNTRRIY